MCSATTTIIQQEQQPSPSSSNATSNKEGSTKIKKMNKDTSSSSPSSPASSKPSSCSSSSSNTTRTATSFRSHHGSHTTKETFWGQELYRYYPSFWLVVRIGSLLAFPCVASFLGKQYAYPYFVNLSESYDIELDQMVPPILSIVGMVWYFAHNLLYGILYYYEIPYFDKYRVDDKPWHWDMLSEQNWKQMMRNTVGLILFNFVGLSLPIVFLNVFLGGKNNALSFVRMDAASLPSGLEILWQLLFCLVIEDFGFHHTHALLHTPQLYWIHKIHHQYHAPISFAAAYSHPLEYVFGNVGPSIIGPFILQDRMHIWTFGVWMVFRASAAIENHSGYEFPWSMYQAIPFKAPTEYHDFHHNRNQGTYSGVLRFWDYVYGTNTQYFEWVQQGRPDTLKTMKFKKQHLTQQQEQQPQTKDD